MNEKAGGSARRYRVAIDTGGTLKTGRPAEAMVAMPRQIFRLPRVVAWGVVPKPEPARASEAGGRLPDAANRRPVHFGKEHGLVDTPMLRRDGLEAGMVLEGSMVIEQLDSTVVLPPDTRSEVTPDLHTGMQFN